MQAIETEQKTRERLIEAAGQVFARDGFERAGVREICRIADANVASVKYYFGGKSELYREVVLRGVREMTSRPAPSPDPDSDPIEAFEELISYFLRFTLIDRHNHPYVGQIMKHEMREPTPMMDEVAELLVAPLHARMTKAIAAIAKDAACDRPADHVIPDARMTAVFVLGLCANLETSRFLLERLKFKFPTDVRGVNRLASQVVHFVLHGVRGSDC